MSDNYTKLFNSILTSTIWGESHPTRIVWITLLALADKNGEIQATVPGLARIALVTIDEAKEAIKKLKSPDEYSRTDDMDGRRIEEIDGGWLIINHAKYRNMASREDMKMKNAERQKRFRERAKNKGGEAQNQMPLRGVTSNAPVTQPLHIADTDTDTDADDREKKREKKREGKESPGKSPELLRIESWFGRRVATTPTNAEAVAWRKARKAVEDTTEDEWQALERFYRAPQDQTYARRSISVLLNNWQSEIDRAKIWRPKNRGEYSDAF